MEDQIRAINHILAHTITGPVNLEGPVHATNAEIGRALARKLHRPFLLPTPTVEDAIHEIVFLTTTSTSRIGPWNLFL
ncbi:hypothetical protein CAY35_07245 [Pseudoglutamicibacter cumminsii]|uniref:Uncharacterized protein n=1 Tax=Pseudoglutamicibacter cumminsii TaxID=156979 RepID=A0ABX5L832_9MICC|nr:hypothetical protein CAY35_07245 [Pseudoglutamicibacter cumminsii]